MATASRGAARRRQYRRNLPETFPALGGNHGKTRPYAGNRRTPPPMPRLSRRSLLLAALGAGTVALLLWDPLGLADAVRAWLRVASPAAGSVPEALDVVAARRQRLDRLAALRDRQPLLSLASLAAGAGAGLSGGGVGAFLYYRRQIRRGEWRE